MMGAYAVHAVREMAHQTGSELLVLLAFADAANDEGVGVFPDLEELGRRINLSKTETTNIVSSFTTALPTRELDWWSVDGWTVFKLADVEFYREHEQEILDHYIAGMMPPAPPDIPPPPPKVRLAYVKAVVPPEIRWAVWERDNFTCQHCGSRQNLSIDHVHPESKGGPTELTNLQTLCKPCNSRKGDRLPGETEG